MNAQAPMHEPQEPLIPVPVPPLAVLLLTLQERMQRPLTKIEVIIARDRCHCIMMTPAQKEALEQERGYADVDPNHVWESWLAFLAAQRQGE